MESNKNNLLHLKVNEQPEKDHKKQSFWQIWFPLGITFILFILITVSASISSASNKELGLHWANVSTILLLIPVLFASVLFLIILAGLIYGLGKLLSIAPPYFGQAIEFFNQASQVVLAGANKIIAPVLSIRIQSSKIKAIKSIFQSSPERKTGTK